MDRAPALDDSRRVAARDANDTIGVAQAIKNCLCYLRQDAAANGLAVTAELVDLAVEGVEMDLERLRRVPR